MTSADTLSRGDVVDMETGLQKLIARGYQFVHPRDRFGQVVAVVGVRVHDQVIDVVRLNAEDDVVATRMPAGEADILAPKEVLWRMAGSVRVVLKEVLALAEDCCAPSSLILPDTPDTPAATGCWVPGDGGKSKWLASPGLK